MSARFLILVLLLSMLPVHPATAELHPDCDKYLRQVVATYFPKDQIDIAMKVMDAESDCDPKAVNNNKPNSCWETGLFQFTIGKPCKNNGKVWDAWKEVTNRYADHPRVGNKKLWRPANVISNIMAANWLSQNIASWGRWYTCKNPSVHKYGTVDCGL